MDFDAIFQSVNGRSAAPGDFVDVDGGYDDFNHLDLIHRYTKSGDGWRFTLEYGYNAY